MSSVLIQKLKLKEMGFKSQELIEYLFDESDIDYLSKHYFCLKLYVMFALSKLLFSKLNVFA